MSDHFVWPGYGHAAKTNEGFHNYPEPMKMVPMRVLTAGGAGKRETVSGPLDNL